MGITPIHTEETHPLPSSTLSLSATLWGVLLVALLARALVMADGLDLFPMEPMHFKGSDQRTYLEWARQIGHGDWLGLERGPFYFSPLAPYLVGLTFALLNTDSLLVVLAWNTMAGTAAALLAALIARRLFGPMAGLLAGLLLALNGAQIALEFLLLNDTLLPALLLGALWCAMEIQKRHENAAPPRWSLAAACGLLLGLAILGRPSNLLPALAVGLALLWSARRAGPLPWRATFLPMGLLILLLTALPILYNGWFHGLWAPTSNGPFNLYVGNSKLATGVFDMQAELVHGSQPPEFWTAQLMKELAADPGLLLRNLAWKTQLLFNAWVAPDNWNYYFSRQQIPALSLFTIDPTALHLLGYAGILLTWSRRRELGLFYIMTGAFCLSLLVVFISGRYKLPLHGLLAIVAGGGMAMVWDEWRQNQRRPLLLWATALAVALPLTLPRPALSISPPALFPLRPNDFFNIALSFQQAGMEARTVALLEPFLANSPVFSSESAMLLANLQIRQNRPQPAAALMERALQDTKAPPHIRRLWMEVRLQALALFASEAQLKQAIKELLVVAPNHPLGELLTQ